MPAALRSTGTVPIPDPTLLTTAALTREVAALKELVVTRLDAMDKAQTIFDTNLNRVPTDTDKQIAHLKELHDAKFVAFDSILAEKITAAEKLKDEKFASIQTQFRERDVRAEQSSKDSKVAADAALQAAKEAVGEQNKSSGLAIAKSEASTLKQIDQMSNLIQAGFKSVDDKFDDIKERITRMEGSDLGKGASAQHSQWSIGVVVVIVIAVISLAASVYSARSTPPQVIAVPQTVTPAAKGNQ